MRNRSLLTRWLGVGLASCLAVTTLTLWITGRLALYVNPDSAWFVVGMSIVLLVGTVASFALPLGAEDDHGHSHSHSHTPHAHAGAHPVRVPLPAQHAEGDRGKWDTSRGKWDTSGGKGDLAGGMGRAATVAGGALASGVVVTMLIAPPASLSAELAMSRDVGGPPLFAGADVVTLASSADTSEFGVGDWASVFATATNPDTFDGDPISLTGFVTPGEDGTFDLTRLVITHCVIDAQPASLPVSTDAAAPETGQWVTITGTVRSTTGGGLEVRASDVATIDEPADPYEY